MSDLAPDRREAAELATARVVAALMHRGAYVDGKPITWEQLPATAQAAAMAFARPAVAAALHALEWPCSGCDTPEAACRGDRGAGARACCPDCTHARWDGTDE